MVSETAAMSAAHSAENSADSLVARKAGQWADQTVSSSAALSAVHLDVQLADLKAAWMADL